MTTEFTPYEGWEADVYLLASVAEECYQGTKMATEKGMPEALAAQRILAHTKRLCGEKLFTKDASWPWKLRVCELPPGHAPVQPDHVSGTFRWQK